NPFCPRNSSPLPTKCAKSPPSSTAPSIDSPTEGHHPKGESRRSDLNYWLPLNFQSHPSLIPIAPAPSARPQDSPDPSYEKSAGLFPPSLPCWSMPPAPC